MSENKDLTDVDDVVWYGVPVGNWTMAYVAINGVSYKLDPTQDIGEQISNLVRSLRLDPKGVYHVGE